MNRYRITRWSLALALVLTVVRPPTADARDGDDRQRDSHGRSHDSERQTDQGRDSYPGRDAREYQQQRSISSEQAAAIARRAYNGRVVSVQSMGQGGWMVRVLVDGGRVKTIHVDGGGSIRGSD